MHGFSLGPKAKASGARLVAFESVGSTNAEAMAAARAGERGPAWFVTAEQTAGRGRRGNVWSHPRGNLGATLLRSYDLPAAVVASLGFVAGLALDEALHRHRIGGLGIGLDGGEVDGGGRFALKWPNDMLAGSAKLAGILLEAEATPTGTAVAVGIGINVVAAPAGLPYPATSLADLGIEATAQSVFAALSDAWVDLERTWNGGEGLSAIRRQWLTRAAGIGGPIAVKSGERILRGTFETLDDECRLVVRTAEGPVTVAAGEVHFGAVASAPA